MFDTTNGAKCSTYSWSQTHSDIDVFVEIPDSISKSQLVSVIIESNHFRVSVRVANQWITKLDGQLMHPIVTSESVWTLHPSKYIHISLAKTMNRWWSRLAVDETQISVGQSAKEIQFYDLNADERLAIERLTLQQKDKLIQKNRQLS